MKVTANNKRSEKFQILAGLPYKLVMLSSGLYQLELNRKNSLSFPSATTPSPETPDTSLVRTRTKRLIIEFVPVNEHPYDNNNRPLKFCGPAY